MPHSDCEWTCGSVGKNRETVKSFENTCHTWVLLRWWFTTKKRFIKCMYLYLYILPTRVERLCISDKNDIGDVIQPPHGVPRTTLTYICTWKLGVSGFSVNIGRNLLALWRFDGTDGTVAVVYVVFIFPNHFFNFCLYSCCLFAAVIHDDDRRRLSRCDFCDPVYTNQLVSTCYSGIVVELGQRGRPINCYSVWHVWPSLRGNLQTAGQLSADVAREASAQQSHPNIRSAQVILPQT